MDFSAILNAAKLLYASDVHISADSAILARVAGRLKSLDLKPLKLESIDKWLEEHLDEMQRSDWRAGRQVDFSLFDKTSSIRVRLTVYTTYTGTAIAVRLLSELPPTLAELGAPEFLTALKPFQHGLVLITGPTGSGKSTTLASWIAHANQNYPAHIVTLEDPIEYRFDNNRCLIHQTEVEKCKGSYAGALRDVLRRDPDTIVVGELRDLPSIELAMHAAETGHLVIATLHSSSSVEAISRLIDIFPSMNKAFVRHVFASVLVGIVSQRLVRCNTEHSKQGRIAVYEVLTSNAAVRNLIKESKESQLPAVMQTSAAFQMFTFSQHYQKLLDARVVSDSMPIWVS